MRCSHKGAFGATRNDCNEERPPKKVTRLNLAHCLPNSVVGAVKGRLSQRIDTVCDLNNYMTCKSPEMDS